MSTDSARIDSYLFEPVKLGPLQLPNRIVMAPLTRSRAKEGDVPGELAIEYYAQRASAGQSARRQRGSAGRSAGPVTAGCASG